MVNVLCLCRLVLPVVTALSLAAVEEVAAVLAVVVAVVETNRHSTANILYDVLLIACWSWTTVVSVPKEASVDGLAL